MVVFLPPNKLLRQVDSEDADNAKEAKEWAMANCNLYDDIEQWDIVQGSATVIETKD